MIYKKCIVQVFLLNAYFSSELADAEYAGEESENNRRYQWEDEFSITSEITNIEVLKNASYPLQGVMPDGEEFRIEIPNMLLFEILSKNAPLTYFGASKSIVQSYEMVENEEGVTIRIFLKDDEPMANPVPGVYIASQAFPQKLVS